MHDVPYMDSQGNFLNSFKFPSLGRDASPLKSDFIALQYFDFLSLIFSQYI